MLPVIRPASIVAAVVAALALTACAPLSVSSYLERDADFTRYHSYAWVERTAFSTGDPRLDNNRFFSQRVEEAIDMQLGARGYEKVSRGDADLLIHIHASVDQRLESAALDRIDGHCIDNDCRSRVYDTGTLLVDLTDRRTNRLAWRGWAEGTFDSVIDEQRSMETAIDAAVAKIFARLPRNDS